MNSPLDISSIKQSVLVTGASGFIGSYLCHQLCQRGATVHGTTRNRSVTTLIQSPVQWHYGDISNADDLRRILTEVKPDLVFHLAGYVSGSRSVEAVLPTLHSHVVGTVNLLTLLAELGCQRLVIARSLEEPDRDTTLSIPSSPYAAAKWSSYLYAQMFHQLYQLPVVGARLFMVYGPAQQDTAKLIPYVTLSLLKGEAPQLSSGKRQVDWIHVEDAVEGLIAIALAPGIEGKTFDFGSGTMTSIAETVQRLVQLVDPSIQPQFGALPERPLEQIRAAMISETHAAIGWQPKIEFDRGLAQTVQWYSQQMDCSGDSVAKMV